MTQPSDDMNDETLSRHVLRGVMLKSSASDTAKASAARTLLELIGRLGKHSDPLKSSELTPVSEMSIEEINAELEGDQVSNDTKELFDLTDVSS